jgi:hypothetical protein
MTHLYALEVLRCDLPEHGRGVGRVLSDPNIQARSLNLFVGFGPCHSLALA